MKVLEILFSDRDYAVCIKPVGVDSEKEMVELLKTQLPGDFFPVHRLDLNVGGVMVYARNTKAAAALSKAITDGSFIKEYLAMVHGTPENSGDWKDFLFKDSRKNKVFVVKKERKGVKAARLTYEVLTSGETSLVHIRLYTGRSHQIRVQFSSRGFPLVGDHKYGSRDEATAPLLYSHKVTFPWHGETKTYSAKPDWA